MVYTAFVCINCRVINRYGQPEGQPSPFDLLRRRDLTILGFGSFVENKLTGRIPAFAYAGDLSPRSHKLGWVLAKKPGIILNFIKKMQSLLGDQAGRLQELVQGTIRLEYGPTRKNSMASGPPSTAMRNCKEGLAILHAHLGDGRWTMDEYGNWRYHGVSTHSTSSGSVTCREERTIAFPCTRSIIACHGDHCPTVARQDEAGARRRCIRIQRTMARQFDIPIFYTSPGDLSREKGAADAGPPKRDLLQPCSISVPYALFGPPLWLLFR